MPSLPNGDYVPSPNIELRERVAAQMRSRHAQETFERDQELRDAARKLRVYRQKNVTRPYEI